MTRILNWIRFMECGRADWHPPHVATDPERPEKYRHHNRWVICTGSGEVDGA